VNAETLRSHARRVAVIGAVAGVQVVWSAQSAAAGTMTEGSVGLTDPVGIVAVVLGIGGLIVGLIRRRKVAKPVANAVPLPGPRQAASPLSARATVSQD
jgi:hypothetical protein